MRLYTTKHIEATIKTLTSKYVKRTTRAPATDKPMRGARHIRPRASLYPHLFRKKMLRASPATLVMTVAIEAPT